MKFKIQTTDRQPPINPLGDFQLDLNFKLQFKLWLSLSKMFSGTETNYKLHVQTLQYGDNTFSAVNIMAV